MQLVKSAYFNNSFVGLFSRASDSLAFAPLQAPSKFIDAMTTALKVPIHQLLVNQSNLLGLCCAMNSNGMVIQSSAEAPEVKQIRALGLNVCVMDHQSPGINLLANDKGAWASPRVPPHSLIKIQDALGVEVYSMPFSIPALASSTVVTNGGFFSSSELTGTEVKQLEKIFRVKGGVGTTNTGVPFNALGMIANSKGAIVGHDSSGFEVQRIYEALQD